MRQKYPKLEQSELKTGSPKLTRPQPNQDLQYNKDGNLNFSTGLLLPSCGVKSVLTEK